MGHYQSWLENKEGFWQQAAEDVIWHKPYHHVFSPNDGPYGRWFTGATCNTAYNCLDRHVPDRPGQAAFIHHSEMTGDVTSISYEELRDEVAVFAKVLADQGVTKGDRVIIYMPMLIETAIAMLACARIGAVHSVVFGGFAATELAVRIDDCTPKLIVAASCGLEPGRTVAYKPMIDQAIDLAAHKIESTIILQRAQLSASLNRKDHDWASLVQKVKDKGETAPCVPVAATDPLYILYTSGTTGTPKGVVRDNGGHMVALKWSMKHIYGIQPGEVMWAASDMGWVVGHSYIVYGPLLQGATSLIYEGKPVGTPDAAIFWRLIEKYNVHCLFTAPTAVRAIKSEDPAGKGVTQHDTSSLRALFLAGERADPDTISWAKRHLNKPVIDHWWQTETGWAITGIMRGTEKRDTKTGSSNLPMPGYQLEVLNEEGTAVAEGDIGALAIKLPLPPGCAYTLWQDDERYQQSYLSMFEGYYVTQDAGFIDEEGYVFVMARTDDVINVAGHRLSTGAMEEVITNHKDVAECAVVGIKDELKGQLPLALLSLNKQADLDPQAIEQEVIQLVREKIGPVAALKTAITVERLPKTRSGKILRKTIRNIADGETVKTPPTIDDPESLLEIENVLAKRGVLQLNAV